MRSEPIVDRSAPAPSTRRARVTRAAAATGAVAAALVLSHHAPSFAFLGPRGELFGWLAYATAVTAGLPVAVMALGFRRPISSWGWTWGQSRLDAPWIALGALGAVALAWVVSRAPEMQAHYPHYRFVKTEPLLWIPSTLAFATYGLAWETAFRGVLVLGVVEDKGAPRWEGAAAVALQAVVYTVAHLDKPPLEAWLSFPAGLFFGWAALRTRSILPGFLVHFTLSVSVNLFCVYG